MRWFFGSFRVLNDFTRDICQRASFEINFVYVCRLPEHVSLDEGALLEPLSVAIYSCRRGEVKAGDKILICGAGWFYLSIYLSYLIYIAPLHRLKVVSEVLYNIHLYKACQFFIPV